MESVNTTIKMDNRIEREEEWIFQSKDNLGLKNYLEIKNKFFNKPFLSHIHIGQLRDLRCKVNANLDYKIVFDNNTEVYLFSNTIMIDNMEEEDDDSKPIIGEKWKEIKTNEGIKAYNGKFTIKVVINIMYYKRFALWDYRLD